MWKFSYFKFKITLIRQALSFPKQKFLHSNSQPTDHQSGVINIPLKSQRWVGNTENLSLAFSLAWLILVEITSFSYKNGKNNGPFEFFTNTQSWQCWHYCQNLFLHVCSFLHYLHQLMLVNVKLKINGYMRITFKGYTLPWTSWF